MEKETVTFNISRFDPDKDKKPHFQKFEIPFLRKDLTVLEGLNYIQQRLDHSLAYRSSCRAAICGSCAMHINGKYRLACNT
ncbi:MAG: 2Fe-2S iron-sulfur cluster-binding protein, partial [Planctomycetota bacterium]